MKKRGSALIIAILLIAGVGAVAFGISRLLFLETSKASLYENGVYAYYAAESGIEEGFLRYKYKRNIEIPKPDASWSLTDDRVFRTNITAGSIDSGGVAQTGVNPTTSIALSNLKQQIYDLRVGYLGTENLTNTGAPILRPWFGRDIGNTMSDKTPDNQLNFNDYMNTNGYSSEDFGALTISQDNSLKVDLSNLNPVNDIYLDITFNSVANTTVDKCRAIAELKLSLNGTQAKEFKDLITYNSTLCSSAFYLNIDQNKLTSAIGTPYYDSTRQKLSYRIRVNSIYEKAGESFSSAQPFVLMLKPLYKSASVGIFVNSCNSTPSSCSARSNIVAGPSTYVKATGYYGGVERNLVANIDRLSGTIYDLFDYVLYKEN